MKHDLSVTLLLVFLFLAAQIIGLMVLYNDMDVQIIDGVQRAVHGATAIGERPDVYGFDAFIFFAVAIAVGTGLILVIMFLGKYIIWKLLFLYAVIMTMTISFGVFIDGFVAFLIALLLGIVKVFRPNPVVHNATEVFMYAGIAVLFVPLFNVLWAIALLLLISVYDFIAVFKLKHMVSMAKFQTQGDAFAGLLIKYNHRREKTIKEKEKTKPTAAPKASLRTVEQTSAILGGGDIVFPLLFAGVLLEAMINAGTAPAEALLKIIVIPVVVSLFLACLLVYGKRGKFYPAMPVITAGCLVGLGIVWLLL